MGVSWPAFGCVLLGLNEQWPGVAGKVRNKVTGPELGRLFFYEWNGNKGNVRFLRAYAEPGPEVLEYIKILLEYKAPEKVWPLVLLELYKEHCRKTVSWDCSKKMPKSEVIYNVACSFLGCEPKIVRTKAFLSAVLTSPGGGTMFRNYIQESLKKHDIIIAIDDPDQETTVDTIRKVPDYQLITECGNNTLTLKDPISEFLYANTQNKQVNSTMEYHEFARKFGAIAFLGVGKLGRIRNTMAHTGFFSG